MTAARDRLLSGEQALPVGVAEGAGAGVWELPLMMNDCVFSLRFVAVDKLNLFCCPALRCVLALVAYACQLGAARITHTPHRRHRRLIVAKLFERYAR